MAGVVAPNSLTSVLERGVIVDQSVGDMNACLVVAVDRISGDSAEIADYSLLVVCYNIPLNY